MLRETPGGGAHSDPVHDAGGHAVAQNSGFCTVWPRVPAARQVFIGMESINPKNLKAAGKMQNHVQDYRDLISAWHSAKIATHIAYIFGFPFDTPESIREDVQRLQNELGGRTGFVFHADPDPRIPRSCTHGCRAESRWIRT